MLKVLDRERRDKGKAPEAVIATGPSIIREYGGRRVSAPAAAASDTASYQRKKKTIHRSASAAGRQVAWAAESLQNTKAPNAYTGRQKLSGGGRQPTPKPCTQQRPQRQPDRLSRSRRRQARLWQQASSLLAALSQPAMGCRGTLRSNQAASRGADERARSGG